MIDKQYRILRIDKAFMKLKILFYDNVDKLKSEYHKYSNATDESINKTITEYIKWLKIN